MQGPERVGLDIITYALSEEDPMAMADCRDS